MIVLRPTRTAAKALAVTPLTADTPSPGPLRDWYVNVVPTLAGELYVFVDATTLAAVAVPTRESEVLSLLRIRVANLLGMFELPRSVIETELGAWREIVIARPSSRSIQTSANDIAHHFQQCAEAARKGKPLSLSAAELHVAQIPFARLSFATPREEATRLILQAPHT